MGAYVPMVCGRCRRRQERWANSRFCPCGGRLALCERASRGPVTFAAATGRVIRRTRLAAGMTAAELARRAKLSKGFLSDVETGKRDLSLENWYALTVALNGRYAALLGEVVRLYLRPRPEDRP